MDVYTKCNKRVFKFKTFERWARKILTDAELCTAAREILDGRYEADLGGGVCKKRVAPAGRGKSGGTRTLVAKESDHAIFFIAGREKNEPGKDFSDVQIDAAKILAKAVQGADAKKIGEMKLAGTIKEICDEQVNKQA